MRFRNILFTVGPLTAPDQTRSLASMFANASPLESLIISVVVVITVALVFGGYVIANRLHHQNGGAATGDSVKTEADNELH